MKKKAVKNNITEIESEKPKELEREIEKTILTDLQAGNPLDIEKYVPQYPKELVMNILHSLQKDKGCIEDILFSVAGGKVIIRNNKAKVTYRGEQYLNKLQ